MAKIFYFGIPRASGLYAMEKLRCFCCRWKMPFAPQAIDNGKNGTSCEPFVNFCYIEPKATMPKVLVKKLQDSHCGVYLFAVKEILR
jgi:hypothetical protein